MQSFSQSFQKSQQRSANQRSYQQRRQSRLLALRSIDVMRHNLSLEWTSANWPRYAHQFIIAARGQLSSAPQLQRYVSGRLA